MQGFTKIEMAGNLVRDPEIRYRIDGTPVASMVIAINRAIKHEFREEKWVDFLDVIKTGDDAETVAVDFKKGRAVRIEGILIQQRWDGRNGKRSRLVVEAVSIEAAHCEVGREG